MISTKTKKTTVSALALVAFLAVLPARSGRADLIISTMGDSPDSGTAVATAVGVAITVGSTAINVTSVDFEQSAGVTSGQAFYIVGSTGSGSNLALNMSNVVYSDFTQTYSNTTKYTTESVATSLVLSANTTYYLVLVGKNNGNGTYQDVSADYTTSTASSVPASLVSTPSYNSTAIEGLQGAGGTATTLTYYSQNPNANNNTGYGQSFFDVYGSPQAVPEPTSLSLAGIAGLVGTTVALIRRRRARVSA